MDTKTHRNIKIFLVKIIDNMIDIFTHYSKWFLEPLLQFVIDKCAGDTINYFITDVVSIIVFKPLRTLSLDGMQNNI